MCVCAFKHVQRLRKEIIHFDNDTGSLKIFIILMKNFITIMNMNNDSKRYSFTPVKDIDCYFFLII